MTPSAMSIGLKGCWQPCTRMKKLDRLGLQKCLGRVCWRTMAPLRVCSYLRAAMRSSWFSLQPGTGRYYETATGTIPGTPLADLLYQEILAIFLPFSEAHAVVPHLQTIAREADHCCRDRCAAELLCGQDRSFSFLQRLWKP